MANNQKETNKKKKFTQTDSNWPPPQKHTPDMWWSSYLCCKIRTMLHGEAMQPSSSSRYKLSDWLISVNAQVSLGWLRQTDVAAERLCPATPSSFLVFCQSGASWFQGTPRCERTPPPLPPRGDRWNREELNTWLVTWKNSWFEVAQFLNI